MKKITAILVAFACVGILLFSTCTKSDLTSGGPSSSQVAVRLKDAPSAMCEHVWMHIRGFRIRTFHHGLITIPVNDTTVDILQLKDSSLLIGMVNIPADTITEISLMLGTDDSVTIGGVNYVLSDNFNNDSDLVSLQIQETAAPGKTYTFIIDLDASQSIFVDDKHHGWYDLKPYLHWLWGRG